LLSIEALRNRQIPIAGVIFNGPSTPASEKAIQEIGKVHSWLRVDEIADLNPQSFAALVGEYGPLIRTKTAEWFSLYS
jgi:dethiobiotin synthetase